jgi:amino acid permease
MKRDMSAFRYVSLMSIAALLYTAVILLIELPGFYKKNEPTAEYSPAYFDFNIFTGCSMTFFAFQCQVQLLPIYSELIEPNYRRVTKVIDRAIAVDLTFYLTIALAGFFS